MCMRAISFVGLPRHRSTFRCMQLYARTRRTSQFNSVLETLRSQKPSLQSLRVQRSWTSTATRRTKRKGCTKGPSEFPLPWFFAAGLAQRHTAKAKDSEWSLCVFVICNELRAALAWASVPSPSLHRRVGAGREVAAEASWPHGIGASTKADDGSFKL